jgi:hypothetical protein
LRNIRWCDTPGGLPSVRLRGDLRAPVPADFLLKARLRQFSITSGTIFHARKLTVRDILLAIAVFANSAMGHSALHLSRDPDLLYKTAFVLAHKIREALGTEMDDLTAGSKVHVDGAYFDGYVKPANWREKTRHDGEAAGSVSQGGIK